MYDYRLKFQLKELHVMHNDAIIRRDKAKADLEREEKEIYADRKQRELEIQKVRKEAEEKKVQAQLIQRRIVSYCCRILFINQWFITLLGNLP